LVLLKLRDWLLWNGVNVARLKRTGSGAS